MEAGETVLLRRQPENAYDPRAVEALKINGQSLGYVPRIHNQAIANLMDAGVTVSARVHGVRPDRHHPEVLLDVFVAIQPGDSA